MALSNLPQPDTTSDGKTSSRWMFLLWQYVTNWTGENQNTVISTRVYSPHPQPFYTSLNSVDSQNIMAGQIFGS